MRSPLRAIYTYISNVSIFAKRHHMLLFNKRHHHPQNQKTLAVWCLICLATGFILGFVFNNCNFHWPERLPQKQRTTRSLYANRPPTPKLNITSTTAGHKKEVQVVVFVPTPRQWEDRRANVARQFLKERWNDSQAILIFVIGTKTGQRLEYELDSPHQVTHIPGIDYYYAPCRDYGDEFDNPNGTSGTTCKVYEGLRYITTKYKAKYVWRSGDDAYLNLKVFFRMLNTQGLVPQYRLYMGWLRSPTLQSPSRTKDLLLSRQPRLRDLYGIHQFGSYMFGMGFCLSWDVAEFIGQLSIPPLQTWAEDVIVGMWLMPFEIDFLSVNDMANYYMLNIGETEPETHRACLLSHYMRQIDWDLIYLKPNIWA